MVGGLKLFGMDATKLISAGAKAQYIALNAEVGHIGYI
jgi:hypothetical protein